MSTYSGFVHRLLLCGKNSFLGCDTHVTQSLCTFLLRWNEISTAHNWAHWSSHCGYCPHPSSLALCLPCAAGRLHCGHGPASMKIACCAHGAALDSGDGCGHALWCHCETARRPRQWIPSLSWCHPGPWSCSGYYRWCLSLASPAGRPSHGGGGPLHHHWSRSHGTHRCPHQTAWLERGGVYGRCYFLQPSQPGKD